MWVWLNKSEYFSLFVCRAKQTQSVNKCELNDQRDTPIVLHSHCFMIYALASQFKRDWGSWIFANFDHHLYRIFATLRCYKWCIVPATFRSRIKSVLLSWKYLFILHKSFLYSKSMRYLYHSTIPLAEINTTFIWTLCIIMHYIHLFLGFPSYSSILNVHIHYLLRHIYLSASIILSF